jgi:hypothetical protein
LVSPSFHRASSLDGTKVSIANAAKVLLAKENQKEKTYILLPFGGLTDFIRNSFCVVNVSPQ